MPLRRSPFKRAPDSATHSSLCGLPGRLFVQSELVADRVTECGEGTHTGSDLGARSQNFPPRAWMSFSDSVDVVHHDVSARALVRPANLFLYPRSAHS